MSSTEATNHNVDYIIKKGQVLWEQRTDSSALSQAEHFLTLAYEQRPENFELAILLGKINYTRPSVSYTHLTLPTILLV